MVLDDSTSNLLHSASYIFYTFGENQYFCDYKQKNENCFILVVKEPVTTNAMSIKLCHFSIIHLVRTNTYLMDNMLHLPFLTLCNEGIMFPTKRKGFFLIMHTTLLSELFRNSWMLFWTILKLNYSPFNSWILLWGIFLITEILGR